MQIRTFKGTKLKHKPALYAKYRNDHYSLDI